jgi:hypothetical protein
MFSLSVAVGLGRSSPVTPLYAGCECLLWSGDSSVIALNVGEEDSLSLSVRK